MPVLLEVCVDGPEGLAAAIAGGAGRIELCSALSLQGLTPAPGLMAQAANIGRDGASIPVYPMLRPRPGDFCYDDREIDAILRDIDAVRTYGLPGIVIGANLANGELDVATLKRLMAHAEGLDATLHRSIDLTPDLFEALEIATDLGFSRVLTSGGALTAQAGAETIAALVEQGRGRISILAGAGVTPANVAEIVTRTGVTEVHGSCSGPAARGMTGPDKAHGMGFLSPGLRDTHRETVEAVVAALKRF